jgi:hypothetical protein
VCDVEEETMQNICITCALVKFLYNTTFMWGFFFAAKIKKKRETEKEIEIDRAIKNGSFF